MNHGAEKKIAHARLEILRLKDSNARHAPGSEILGSSPGGAITEIDRRLARSEALLQQSIGASARKASHARLDDSGAASGQGKKARESGSFIKDIEDEILDMQYRLENGLMQRGGNYTYEREKRKWRWGCVSRMKL